MFRLPVVLMFTASTACLAPAEEFADTEVAEEPQSRQHTFPTIELGAAEEIDHLCASWTLGNAEALHVNQVDMVAGPGWHHSNWFVVSESQAEGPDGVWPCKERNFDALAGAIGGGVIFAQSTQARRESQSFAEGAAVRVPPRSRIVGQLHLLNAGGEPFETDLSLELLSIPESDVEHSLQPLVFQYTSLEIPPLARSEFEMICDFEEQLGGPMDFGIYYALAHYHELGTRSQLKLVGGERDGEVVFDSQSAIGEPLGQAFSPALDVSGATGLAMSCSYDNPRQETVGFGIGDQEMCLVMAFTNAKLRFASAVESPSEALGEVDGVQRFGGPCLTIALPPWR